jgi:biotin carboxyl carrier protein
MELVKSPLPGRILNISVSEGQEVKKGQVLFVLESMKMHNEIVSDISGIVSKIFIEEDSSVPMDANILEIETIN